MHRGAVAELRKILSVDFSCSLVSGLPSPGSFPEQRLIIEPIVSVDTVVTQCNKVKTPKKR